MTICAVVWAAAESQVGLPRDIRMVVNQAHAFRSNLPVTLDLSGPLGVARLALRDGRTVAVTPTQLGRGHVEVRLFGLVPLRRRVVEVLPDVRLVPGGQAIGVLVAREGMIVTGLTTVQGVDGGSAQPARDAGVKVGDLITHINGHPVHTVQQLEYLVNRYGEAGLALRIKRGGASVLAKVVPKLTSGRASGEDSRPRPGQIALRPRYRLGIFVEDPAAGVGTLSFFEPASGVYGALGHMITDSVTRRGVDLSDGRIVPAIIAGIQPGLRGQPGEKIGVFQSQGPELGTIERNCEFGIFGRMLRRPAGAVDPLQVALVDEVATGPAQILTVIEDQRVDRFDIEILRVTRYSRRTTKGLVVRIVDPRLLSRTGGIIQGMSGSPIIQSGKLAGVVTHVFVNDPTRGYGVLAEWMVEEAGLFKAAGAETARRAAWATPSVKEEKEDHRRIVI